MQIKRFEAKDMTEALKMIKNEFGAQAVILSAKTIKKSSGLFGAVKKSGVEITAASDRYQPDENKENVKLNNLVNKLNLERKVESSSKTYINGEDENKEAKVQEIKFPQLAAVKEDIESPFIEQLRFDLKEQGVEERLIDRYLFNIKERTRFLTSMNMDDVKEAFNRTVCDKLTVSNEIEVKKEKTSIIAFVGPTGVGKTTTIAKLSVLTSLEKKHSMALISMDNQRIGATVTLEKYAGIIGLPYKNTETEKELKQAVDSFSKKELILIDTPGVAMSDRIKIADLGRQLTAISPDEVHLLISAATKNRDMVRLCNAYSVCGINRLIFTKIDETSCYGNLLNLIEKENFPISYLTNGQLVPENIVKVSPEIISDLFFSSSYVRNSIQNQYRGYKKVINTSESSFLPDGEYFVANKNSDIFHHFKCKAVHRISEDNVVVFQNMTDAKNQNYKPCRMCCTDRIGNDRLMQKFKQKVAVSH